MQPEYVKERLQSLEDIDLKLCSVLQEASHVVYTLGEMKKGNQNLRPQFERRVKNFYRDLQDAITRLREEIRLLDENTGTRLLPINVNKRTFGEEDVKLREQIDLLKEVLSSDKGSRMEE